MGRKKRLSAIVDAVQDILGGDVGKKKLKKKKALRRFVEKMEQRRDQVARDLTGGKLSDEDQARLERHIKTLEKQIKKARAIQEEMEAD